MQTVEMEKLERWVGLWQVGTEKAIVARIEVVQYKKGHGVLVEICVEMWLGNPGSCSMKKKSCPTSCLMISAMSSLLH